MKTPQWLPVKGYPLEIKVEGFSYIIRHVKQRGEQFICKGSAPDYATFKQVKRRDLEELKKFWSDEKV